MNLKSKLKQIGRIFRVFYTNIYINIFDVNKLNKNKK